MNHTQRSLEKENGKKNELVVYIFNIVEDEWSFISTVADEGKKLSLIADCEDAADCYFLSMATKQDFVYISPKPISPEFRDYAQQLLGFKQSEVIVPKLRSHLICDDFLKDSSSFISFITRAKEYKRITLISYCASSQLYALREKLTKVGLAIYSPEAPEIDCAWTVNFFGSKSGIRQLAQKSVAVEPDFVMPEGLICVGRYDAAKIAANLYLKEDGVVIKTNKGSGGNGVLIFREKELPSAYQECEKKIIDYFNADRYWDEAPIVIEHLVNINYSLGGGFPNVEFKIHKNGRIEMLYVCACQVTSKGVYYGLDINEEIINNRLQTRIEDTGYYVAEQYSAAGYRGHFDVDMMFAKNGHIYVCESNTRNTGGTPDYKIAKKLIGKEFMSDAFTMSRSRREMFPKNTLTFANVMDRLESIRYSPTTQEGILIYSENSIPDGKLIYLILAKNKKRAYELETKLYTTITSLKRDKAQTPP